MFVVSTLISTVRKPIGFNICTTVCIIHAIILYLTAYAAPSSGVVNIIARDSDVQSTSVRLTWSPPPIRDWNGVIINYTISECRGQWCLNTSIYRIAGNFGEH